MTLTTFRPNLAGHLTEKNLPDKPKRRKRPTLENRRMSDEYDDDDGDDVTDDVSTNDATLRLIERCKDQLRQKGARPRY